MNKIKQMKDFILTILREHPHFASSFLIAFGLLILSLIYTIHGLVTGIRKEYLVHSLSFHERSSQEVFEFNRGCIQVFLKEPTKYPYLILFMISVGPQGQKVRPIVFLNPAYSPPQKKEPPKQGEGDAVD